MPCVLPVLSVKALGLVQHASERPARPPPARPRLHRRRAGVLRRRRRRALALRAGGEQIGWGFQLQSPVFVTLLAFVLFAIALEPVRRDRRSADGWRGAGQALAGRAGYAGSFFTGALATVAATPCTAPFMGAAVGYAVTQPWSTALLVFEALGLGLALPYPAADAGPGVAALPARARARGWRALAAAAGVSALRLGGVAGVGREPAGRTAAVSPPRSAGLVLIAFAAWLYGLAATLAGLRRRVASVAGARARRRGASRSARSAGRRRRHARREPARRGLGAVQPAAPGRAARRRAGPSSSTSRPRGAHVSRQRARGAARARGRRDAFARKGVVMLKADWTESRSRSSPQVLGSFGRSGVPLYLLYPAGADHRRARRASADPQRRRIVIDALDEPRRPHDRARSEPSHVPGRHRSRRPRELRTSSPPRRRGPRRRQGRRRRARVHRRRDHGQDREPRPTTRGKIVVLEWTNHDCPYVRKHYDDEQHAGAPEGGDRPGRRLAHDHLVRAGHAGLRERRARPTS